MKEYILITEVNGTRYSTTLRNLLRKAKDNSFVTFQFTDDQEDLIVPKSEFISFGEKKGG